VVTHGLDTAEACAERHVFNGDVRCFEQALGFFHFDLRHPLARRQSRRFREAADESACAHGGALRHFFHGPGARRLGAETVNCASLDGLLQRTSWLREYGSYVLKLDVEGVEEAALRGAKTLLSQDTLLIYEEQGSDTHHGNTRHVAETLGMQVFIHRNGHFVEAANPLAEVAGMKKNRRRGYNVVATKSERWLKVLRNI
jgi:FkbM family methyltransferase